MISVADVGRAVGFTTLGALILFALVGLYGLARKLLARLALDRWSNQKLQRAIGYAFENILPIVALIAGLLFAVAACYAIGEAAWLGVRWILGAG